MQALGMADGGAAASAWWALSAWLAGTVHRPVGATSEHWVLDQCPAGRNHASIVPVPYSPHAGHPEEALPAPSSGRHVPAVAVLGD